MRGTADSSLVDDEKDKTVIAKSGIRSTTPHQNTDQNSGEDAPHGYAADKDAYLRRLKRIEGQIRGIARTVDEDKYCIDILTQVAAVNSAMHAVSVGLLQNHSRHCVVDAAHQAAMSGSSEAVDTKVKQATEAISRLLRWYQPRPQPADGSPTLRTSFYAPETAHLSTSSCDAQLLDVYPWGV